MSLFRTSEIARRPKASPSVRDSAAGDGEGGENKITENRLYIREIYDGKS